MSGDTTLIILNHFKPDFFFLNNIKYSIILQTRVRSMSRKVEFMETYKEKVQKTFATKQRKLSELLLLLLANWDVNND